MRAPVLRALEAASIALLGVQVKAADRLATQNTRAVYALVVAPQTIFASIALRGGCVI